jgi:acyl-CoA thioesterase
MTELFFDLKSTHNPHRWYLPLTDGVCVGPPDNLFMYGGIGLASAIAAMERTCNRPVIWATAQYLSYARPPSIVDIDVWIPTEGKYNTQARVTGHVGDKEIFTVNAALGSRESPFSHQWVQAPDMPPPEDCEPSLLWTGQSWNLNSRLEVRMCPDKWGGGARSGELSPDGRSVMWVRPKGDYAIDTSMLDRKSVV